jgi:hypothetical protein
MLTIAEARKDLVKKNTLSTSFFLNDTAVVLYIISDSSIYLVAVTNFALRTEFWTGELFLFSNAERKKKQHTDQSNCRTLCTQTTQPNTKKLTKAKHRDNRI